MLLTKKLTLVLLSSMAMASATTTTTTSLRGTLRLLEDASPAEAPAAPPAATPEAPQEDAASGAGGELGEWYQIQNQGAGTQVQGNTFDLTITKEQENAKVDSKEVRNVWWPVVTCGAGLWGKIGEGGGGGSTEVEGSLPITLVHSGQDSSSSSHLLRKQDIPITTTVTTTTTA